MPRPRFKKGMDQNKVKDFGGSLKRLLASLKPWRIIIIISLLLAGISSVLAIVAPNKLSSLTDTIVEGIKPDVEKLEEISKKIGSSFTPEKMNKKLPIIMMNKDISIEDKTKFKLVMQEIPKKKDAEKMKTFTTIPDSILKELLEDIEVDKTIIKVDDQIVLLNLFSKVSKELDVKQAINIISKFPPSVYKLVEPKIDMKKVKLIALFLLIMYVASALFNFIENYVTTTVSNNFARKLRSSINNKIDKLPLNYFDTHENGDVLSRLTNDVSTIAQNLNDSLATLVSAITMLVGSIIMMFVTNWVMAITAIMASLIGISLVFLILKKSQKYFIRKQKELGDLNGYIEEMYGGHNVIKVYNATDNVIDRFDTLNKKLYVSNRKSQFLSGLMQPIMLFTGNFGYVAVCVVGALLTMNGYISYGVIVAFMMYIRLFTSPLSELAQAMTSLQITTAASERVYEFLDEKEMNSEKNITGKLDKEKVKGQIEFKNVKFGYKPGQTIIKDFSLNAKPGEKIAIVGPTGAGKTTLVNLLMKF